MLHPTIINPTCTWVFALVLVGRPGVEVHPSANANGIPLQVQVRRRSIPPSGVQDVLRCFCNGGFRLLKHFSWGAALEDAPPGRGRPFAAAALPFVEL